jgi:serine/threonine protein kinase
MNSDSSAALPSDPGGLIGHVVLGRYRVVRVLATGGMGVIYLARGEGAAGFVRPVVVKRILGEMVADNTMVRMFKREAKIMSNLRHPGIVTVLDFGREPTGYYMVLDYVHGFHLGRWYRFVRDTRGHFSPEIAIHVVTQVLEALHYAHTLRDPDGRPLHIVHRDVSPSNILIDVEGHVRLADFGIARMQSEHTEFHTTDTNVKGKFPYLPPELLQGDEPSPASDVYACAVVLHEVIRGTNEFRTKDYSSTIAHVYQHTLSALEPLGDDVPAGLDALIARATHKRKEERFQSAMDLLQALRAVRRKSADDAQVELVHTARQDFLSHQMPEVMHVTSLTELDRAWREPPKHDDPQSGHTTGVYGAAASAEEDATKVGRAPKPAHPHPSPHHPPHRGGRSPHPFAIMAIIAGIAALTALIVVAVVMLAPKPAPAPPNITIYQNQPRSPSVRQLDTTAPTTTPADSAERTDQPEQPEQPDPRDSSTSTPHSASNTHRKHHSTALARDTKRHHTPDYTRPLVKRQADIQACVESDTATAEAAKQLQLRVELDVHGTPSAVTISPASIASSPLANCLRRVVQSTRFPSADEPVKFTVPIQTSRTTKPASQ